MKETKVDADNPFRAATAEECDSEEEDEEIMRRNAATKGKRRHLLPLISSYKDDSDESYKDEGTDEDSVESPIKLSKKPKVSEKKSKSLDDDFHINPKVARYIFSTTRSQSRHTMSYVLQLLEEDKDEDTQVQRRKLLMTYQNHTEKIISDSRQRLASTKYSRASDSQYIPLMSYCSCSENRPANHFAFEESCLNQNQNASTSLRTHIANLEDQLRQVKSDMENIRVKKEQLECELNGQRCEGLHPLLRAELVDFPSDDGKMIADFAANSCKTARTAMVTTERIPMGFMIKLLNGTKSPYD